MSRDASTPPPRPAAPQRPFARPGGDPADSSLPGLAVLISGGGRTLTNLGAAIAEGRIPARLALVLASAPCAGCDRARALGVEPIVLGGSIPAQQLGELFDAHGVRFAALAGYLKMLQVPRGFEGRIVNIHPALLPAFGGRGMYGLRVHAAVLQAGCKLSGCTAHLCDAAYDTGAILAQQAVPVLRGDTPETLAARVFQAETELYPGVVAALVEGRVAQDPSGAWILPRPADVSTRAGDA